VVTPSSEARRILLVEPPYHRLFKSTLSLDRYPLGLGYLAAAVRMNTDWDVLVYNADFCGSSEQLRMSYLSGEGFVSYRKAIEDPAHPIWREVRATIEEYRPRVVGITARSPNAASAFRTAALAKEADPSITVVLGGPHATAVGAEALRVSAIDIVAQGEGERTIVELLQAIARGGPLGGITGISYRDGPRLVRNPERTLIEDLDELPIPHEAAPLVLKDHALHLVTAFRHLISSRGCPFACYFCDSRATWGRQVRYRSTDSIMREIHGLREKGLHFIHFSDDTFGSNRQRLAELCEALIDHGQGVQWGCETHVGLIDQRTVALMRRAGCHSIEIGIESGSDEILRKIRKETTIAQALSALEIIHQAGIETVALFVAGFPDDTEATLADTFSAMKRARSDRIHFGIFTPYPGSEAYEDCRARGLIKEDHDPSLYGHQSPLNSFCQNVRHERLREIVTEMEKLADRKNSLSRFRSIFTEVGWRRRQAFDELKRIDAYLRGLALFRHRDPNAGQ
jgi:anaerobic magnesium-protoporphyrin IX monomethyl ester cyclase